MLYYNIIKNDCQCLKFCDYPLFLDLLCYNVAGILWVHYFIIFHYKLLL